MASASDSRPTENNQQFLKDVCFRYIPLAGGASTLFFSTNIMHPVLFKRLFSPSQHVVANCLWFNAHLGTGLYLYSRKHMKRAPKYHRILFSVFGTAVFNFGTVLFWATTKALLPKKNIIRVLFGIGSGLTFLIIGREYLQFVDMQVGSTLSEE